MKRQYCLLLLVPVTLLTIFAACGDSDAKIKSGKLSYAIEYPGLKNQFFVYQVLPKKLDVVFSDNRVRSTVTKAGIENTLYADHSNLKLLAFFKGDGPYYTEISTEDVREQLLNETPFEIIETDERDTLAGLQILKALAVDSLAGDTTEVWYTEELDISRPNWYSRFRNIPGVLVRYSTEQFGVEMEFNLTNFEAVTIPAKDVTFKKHGTKITYGEYTKMLTNLFNSFQ